MHNIKSIENLMFFIQINGLRPVTLLVIVLKFFVKTVRSGRCFFIHLFIHSFIHSFAQTQKKTRAWERWMRAGQH